MAQIIYGLQQIRVGLPANDGGFSTALQSITQATVPESAVISSTEPQITNFPVEELPTPIASVTSQDAVLTFKFSTYDVSVDELILLYGGTKIAAAIGTPEIWEGPITLPTKEFSVEITDKNGGKFKIVRGSLSGVLNFSFSKTKLAQLDLTITVLTPNKANTAPYRYEYPYTAVFGISAQPATPVNQAVGTTLNLSVTAGGKGTLSYQWKKANVNIPGATSATYTKANAQSGDSGTYSVVVTDSYDNSSVTSNNSVVTIS